MPSSTLKRRGGVNAAPLPTDENHPDYPDSCDRGIRSARAGHNAYRKFDALIVWFNSEGKYLSIHNDEKWMFPEELEPVLANLENYDDEGKLKEEWVEKLGEYFIRDQALEHNVLWDEVEPHFVKERMKQRLEYSGGDAKPPLLYTQGMNAINR